MIKYQVNITQNEIIWKETFAHTFIFSKQKLLAFTDYAVFLRPTPKRNFISYFPQ